MKKLENKGSNFFQPFCPVETGITLVSGKWKALIMWKLHYYQPTMRFGELKASLGRISEKMLTQQLHELENVNILEKTVYKENPPRVEYSLTSFGKSMCPILEAFHKWGAENQAEMLEISKKLG